MRRAVILAVLLALSSVGARAMDALHPLSLADVPAAVGTAVLTSDDVQLGHLIGYNEQGNGEFLCFVQLDASLRVDTSPLIVAGLLRHKDGSLRLAEDAATLADRMKLPLPVVR